MKKIYTILFTIVLCSCGEWLNVEPEDQVSEDKLYEKCDGFYTQMNGIYRKLSSSQMWGKEMSWGLVDVLAQYYDMGSYSACDNYGYRNASLYDYEFPLTRPLIDRIWETGYNVIANCNNLIKQTEKADSNLFPYSELERLAILGESHGIRAMVHFEFLRLYASNYVNDSTSSYIPYVSEFPTHIPVKESSEKVMTKIINDLILAHDYTAAFDTIYYDKIKKLSTRLEKDGDSKDRFMEHRGYRLNHYAVKLLLARVNLFRGDYKQARYWAQQITDLHRNNGWFSFTSSYRIKSKGNKKYYDDVLFALYNNKASDFFIEEHKDEDIYMSLQDIDGIFTSEEDKKRDYRYITLKEFGYGDMVSMKFNKQLENEREAEVSTNLIPMLRLSEAYYILAETSFRSNDVDAADAYLNYVRSKRGLRNSIFSSGNLETFLLNLETEMRREQLGEGQMFHFFKRLNRSVPTRNGERIDISRYNQLPIPFTNDI